MQVGDEEPHVTQGKAAPKLTEYLKINIPKALKLGFKFIKSPRSGAPSLNLPDEYMASDIKHPLKDRLDRTFECLKFIESIGAGKAKLENRLDGGKSRGIVQQTKEDEALSNKQYAKDIGEWVDGDALAANYGYGIDYFCTNDQAKGAGTASIFSPSNLEKLSEKFEIKVIAPEELLNTLNKDLEPKSRN